MIVRKTLAREKNLNSDCLRARASFSNCSKPHDLALSDACENHQPWRSATSPPFILLVLAKLRHFSLVKKCLLHKKLFLKKKSTFMVGLHCINSQNGRKDPLLKFLHRVPMFIMNFYGSSMSIENWEWLAQQEKLL